MLKQISLAVLAATSFSMANADDVTLLGDDFSFTYNNDSLFGEAEVVGNSIFFLPTDFNAESLNGQLDEADSVIKVTIKALDSSNKLVTGLEITEKGDYILGGDGMVRASTRVDIFSLTQQGQSTGAQAFDTGLLSAPNDLSNTEWLLNENVNLTWGSDTAVVLSLENTLAALAGNNPEDIAFIAKKSGQIIIDVQTEEVPVPAAAWLFGTALISLGLRKAK